MKMPMTGGCLCGEVRYRCEEEASLAYLCHCTDCQRVSGSAYSANVFVNAASVHIENGTPQRFRTKADSGRMASRLHCPSCGSAVFSEPTRYRDCLVIKAGTLDDARQFIPQMHIWCDSAMPWALPDDSLPRHAKGPEEG